MGGNIPGFPDKTLHGLAKLSIMQSYLVAYNIMRATNGKLIGVCYSGCPLFRGF